jgi:hypothetical protein
MGAPLKIPSSFDDAFERMNAGILGVGLLLIGLAAAYFYLLGPLWQCHEAQKWIATPGQVVGHYSYRYQVAGRSYFSYQYDFTRGMPNGHDGQADAMRANTTPGETTNCYVDPHDPGKAVLSRSFEPNFNLVLAGFFGIAGLAILRLFLKGCILQIKFGKSILELNDAPVAVGGMLLGTITVEKMFRPENGFSVKLACIRHEERGGGKSSRTVETTLWETTQSVQPGMDGSVPLKFSLPQNAAETSLITIRNRILWRVDVKAEVPGVGYVSRFEVPVMRAA